MMDKHSYTFRLAKSNLHQAEHKQIAAVNLRFYSYVQPHDGYCRWPKHVADLNI